MPAVATRKAGSGKPESLREQRHTLLLHRLGEGSLYVPGAPGSGKSTFCRWLALLAAGGTLPDHPIPAPEGFRETLPDALRARFPLLCRLREWAGREEGLSGKGHWTRAQLEGSLSGWLDHTRPGGLTAAVFREALMAGRCLLILDGVDEVPETLPGGHLPRRNFITGLTDALSEWLKRGNRVLLTSRPYGLRDDDRRRLGLSVAELAELPDPLQDTFIRRWYAAADPPKASQKAGGLLQHLAEREELRELRQNPMLSPPSASCGTRARGCPRISTNSTMPWWARCCTSATSTPTNNIGRGSGWKPSRSACTGASPNAGPPPRPK